MKSLLRVPALWTCALVPAAGAIAAAAPAPSSLTADDETLRELEDKIEGQRDDVDPEVVATIAEMGTREAMEVLLRAYDQFGSIYMRRAVLVRLARFDEVEDAYEPALEHLANIATQGRSRDLRVAAIETLGRCREHGKTFLGLIVEAPAADEIRERALELHVRLGGEEDLDWYRKLYDRTSRQAIDEAGGGQAKDDKKRRRKRKKKDEEAPPEEKKEIVWPTIQLKAIALGAIMPTMEDGDLAQAVQRYLGNSVTAPIARTAFQELARRGSKRALEFADALISRPDFRGTDRALAARVIVKERGGAAAKELIDIAKKPTTQAVLRNEIAALLSGLEDEKVDKLLLKLVGKGKGAQKAFASRATSHIRDDKLTNKIRTGIGDKDPLVAIATIDALAARKDRDSIEDLEKLLQKTKDEDVRQAVLRGLSFIYDGENAWVERLKEYGAHEDLDLRNAALNEIRRLGRRNPVDRFRERLSHPDWSTRLIALHALEDQRDVALLGPIVEQMQSESGRMSIEFGDTLFRLTGEPFGDSAAVWKRWYDNEGGDAKIIDESAVESLLAMAEERRLKAVSGAEFFGIRIESHRVAFVIDVSGSMQEPTRGRYVDEPGKPRIEVAKAELSKAIEALEENALFLVLPVSAGVETWIPDGVEECRECSSVADLEYVSRLGPFGGTNLFGGLEAAFEDQDVDTIFVLSDGEPSVGDIIDPQLIREAIEEMNATRNVVIHAVSVGLDLEILRWLAEDTGGTYVGIP
ncbi:MAG: HEAT repeat domain-containing protein [Planctomycetota bacterium]|nr:HEAT repeat domain-containing protein [Planctomycetota bacterium]